MAHIPDGLLSIPVLLGGAVATAAGLAWAMRALDEEAIPRTAVLSAMFFVSSLIAVPVGPSSVHLMLSGLMGLLLGPMIVPAVFIALILQAAMFGFGGLTTLGINTLNIAGPGLLMGAMFAPFVQRAAPSRAGLIGGFCAALAVAGTGVGVAASLALSSSDYTPSTKIIIATYIPLMAVEAVIAGLAITFLKRVKPEALTLRHSSITPLRVSQTTFDKPSTPDANSIPVDQSAL